MALTIFWSVVLYVAALGCSYVHVRIERGEAADDTSEAMTWQLSSIAVLILAYCVSAELVCLPVYRFWDRVIPGRGADIHGFTVFVVMIALALVVTLAYLLIPYGIWELYERVQRKQTTPAISETHSTSNVVSLKK